MGKERAKADLLSGTLDMLVLKMLMRGHLHGYAIAQLISNCRMICCASKKVLHIPLCSAWN